MPSRDILELGALLGAFVLFLLMKLLSRDRLRFRVAGDSVETVRILESTRDMIYAAIVSNIAWIGIAFTVPAPYSYLVLVPVAAGILWKLGKQSAWKAGALAVVLAGVQYSVLGWWT